MFFTSNILWRRKREFKRRFMTEILFSFRTREKSSEHASKTLFQLSSELFARIRIEKHLSHLGDITVLNMFIYFNPRLHLGLKEINTLRTVMAPRSEIIISFRTREKGAQNTRRKRCSNLVLNSLYASGLKSTFHTSEI